MSKWLDFVSDWKDCTRCPLHKVRDRVVLARGKLPCDILFAGEAPGKSEDDLGQPFVGPAGIQQDQDIDRALGDVRVCPVCRSEKVYTIDCEEHRVEAVPLRMAFTNIICCLPLDEERRKVKRPPHESVMACRPRLETFINEFARPRLIVAVGREASDYIQERPAGKKTKKGGERCTRLPDGCKVVEVTHPAAILRQPQAMQSFSRQRVVVALRKAVEGLLS